MEGGAAGLPVPGQLASLSTAKQQGDGTQLYSGAKAPGAKPPASGRKDKAGVKPPAVGDATQGLGGAEAANSATMMSATRVAGPGEATPVPAKEIPGAKRPEPGSADKSAAKAGGADGTMIASSSSGATRSTTKSVPPDQRPPDVSVMPGVSAASATAKSKPKTDGAAQLASVVKQPAVLGGVAALVLVVVIVAAWPHRGTSAKGSDDKLKQRAQELWQNRQFDESEQAWRQLAAVKGPLQGEANSQLADIAQKRSADQQQFDAAMALLADNKDCAGAQQGFSAVAAANLWHAEEAASKAKDASDCLSKMDVRQREQELFDQGEKLLHANPPDFEGAHKAFHAMLDLNLPDSQLKPKAEGYLGKIRQAEGDDKIFNNALQAVKDEKFTEAHDAFADLAKRKGPRSADAKKQLATVDSAVGAINGVQTLINSGSYKAARAQLDSTAQWSKTHDKLANDLHTAEQAQLDSLRSYAQNVEGKADLAGIQRAIDDVHQFQGRAEDATLLSAASELEKGLNRAYTAGLEKSGDKAAFDALVTRYNQAVHDKSADALNKLLPEFQKIASGSGTYHAAAAQYANTTIPSAIATIKLPPGRQFVPPLTCGPGKGGAETQSDSGVVSCAQLDANPALQWVGQPTVEIPEEGKGKLPYTITVMLVVEQSGKVKVEKDGNPDKAFFNKVKDAAKSWKTTPPKSGGKPVTVRMPLQITFQ
jgi:hypothetical protein